MAQPTPTFPPSENKAFYVKELQAHMYKFSQDLQALISDPQSVFHEDFLKVFSKNISELNALIKSISSHTEFKKDLEENLGILHDILNLSIDRAEGSSPLALLEVIKKDAELRLFLSALERYPEFLNVLIQELHLLLKDLESL